MNNNKGIKSSHTFLPHDDPIKEIAYKQNHKGGTASLFISNGLMYSGGDDGVVNIFNITTANKVKMLPISKGTISSIVLTENNNLITANNNKDSIINVINPSVNQSHQLNEHSAPITKLIYDQGVLLSSSLDGTMKLFNIVTNQQNSLVTFQDSFPITAMNWKNSLLVNGNEDGEILLWDVNSNKSFYKKRVHSGSVNNVHFHFDDLSGKQYNMILTTSNTDGVLNCIDMRVSQPIYTKVVHQGGINFLETNSNNIIVTGGIDKQLKIIDIQSGFKELNIFKATDSIICGDINDSFTCVGCKDGCLLGYDFQSMKTIFGYNCDNKGKVRHCKIIDEENMIITGGDSGNDLGLLFE